jgi:hypothetical protein
MKMDHTPTDIPDDFSRYTFLNVIASKLVSVVAQSEFKNT